MIFYEYIYKAKIVKFFGDETNIFKVKLKLYMIYNKYSI